MSNVLEIDSVIKSFGERQILTDIYLKCETGDIIGLLGRNGSGKTTLFKILFGTLSSDRKFIRIDGKIYNRPYLIKNEICYLPQHNFLPKHLTVDKAVRLYVNKASVVSFYNDNILASLKKYNVSNLSGGELRYLEIKLVLYTDSKFVILDEPFNGVSPILIETIKVLIIQAATTKGIILTDHDYRHVLNIANRCFLLFDGGIKNIKDKYDLVRWGYVSESKM
jgi:lipopolysaccharide export system ATP-binding protein